MKTTTGIFIICVLSVTMLSGCQVQEKYQKLLKKITEILNIGKEEPVVVPKESTVPEIKPIKESFVSTSIAVGNFHTCTVVRSSAWCWGLGSSGRLGTGSSTTEQKKPVLVKSLGGGVSAISAGAEHTCAIKRGAAWCWGKGSEGQLGNSGIRSRSKPVKVVGLSSGVSSISAGYSHSCAIKGTAAWCWGLSKDGRLGNGVSDAVVKNQPVRVAGLSKGVSRISTGKAHTCAIVAGEARCWGFGGSNQLGNGSTSDQSRPVKVFSLDSGVTDISAGAEHTCAIKGGAAWCWGEGQQGQLGNGDVVNQGRPVQVREHGSGFSSISAGAAHSCAVVNRSAWCWGSGSSGRIGYGGVHVKTAPVEVIGIVGRASVIAAGYSHTCVLVRGGVVWCWGFGGNGQLGDGKSGFHERLKPIRIRIR